MLGTIKRSHKKLQCSGGKTFKVNRHDLVSNCQNKENNVTTSLVTLFTGKGHHQGSQYQNRTMKWVEEKSNLTYQNYQSIIIYHSPHHPQNLANLISTKTPSASPSITINLSHQSTTAYTISHNCTNASIKMFPTLLLHPPINTEGWVRWNASFLLNYLIPLSLGSVLE